VYTSFWDNPVRHNTARVPRCNFTTFGPRFSIPKERKKKHWSLDGNLRLASLNTESIITAERGRCPALRHLASEEFYLYCEPVPQTRLDGRQSHCRRCGDTKYPDVVFENRTAAMQAIAWHFFETSQTLWQPVRRVTNNKRISCAHIKGILCQMRVISKTSHKMN
jgi:hypothetical protein